MGDGMNTAQHGRFDSFFNHHYQEILTAVTERDPSGSVDAEHRRGVVYTRPGCPYCFTLRAGLRRAGMTFREINIWQHPDAAAFVRSVANGNETVPTVTAGDVRMINPSARQVRELASSRQPEPRHRRWIRRNRPGGTT